MTSHNIMMTWQYDDILMTLWWQYDYIMMTVWWNYDDIMWTLWWQHDDIMMSFFWHYYDSMMIIMTSDDPGRLVWVQHHLQHRGRGGGGCSQSGNTCLSLVNTLNTRLSLVNTLNTNISLLINSRESAQGRLGAVRPSHPLTTLPGEQNWYFWLRYEPQKCLSNSTQST